MTADTAPRRRLGLAAQGAFCLAFGLLCLNYMRPGNREHHVEWAAEHGTPEPATWILVVGALAILIGLASLVGGLRRR